MTLQNLSGIHRLLDGLRKQRNLSDYEGDPVSKAALEAACFVQPLQSKDVCAVDRPVEEQHETDSRLYEPASEGDHGLVPSRCPGRLGSSQFPVRHAVAGILSRHFIMVKIVFDRHGRLS